VVVGTALAVLLLCGVGLAAPAAGGAGGERPARDAGAGSDDAAGLAEELRVGAAELAAVPAESRALFAKVLGRLEGMRGELEELKAGKARSDARAETLGARVAMLEESESECGEGEEEQEEMVTARRLEDDTQPMLDLTRRSAKVQSQQLELDSDSLALRRMQTGGDPLHQSTCTPSPRTS
jgi:hypothetical protein